MFNYYAEWGTKRIPVSEATYKLLMAHKWRHVVTCEGCIIIQQGKK